MTAYSCSCSTNWSVAFAHFEIPAVACREFLRWSAMGHCRRQECRRSCRRRDIEPHSNAIEGMLSILPNMTDLPEAVRDWAKHFEETKTKVYAEQLPSSRGIPPEFVHKFAALQDREIQRFENGRRTTLQKWWKVNQKVFLEKRYRDVVPGEPQVVPPIAPDFASVKPPEKIAPVPVPFGEVAPPRPPLQEAP